VSPTRFRHRIANARYVIRPKNYVVEQGIRLLRPGLFAQFSNHYWDSRAAQLTYGWSDEERELVERRLQENPDFKREWNLGKGGLYPDELEETAKPVHTPEVVGGTCIFTVPTSEGAELCGEPVAEGSEDYCAEHRKIMEEVSA
jgi:hypothetical protein